LFFDLSIPIAASQPNQWMHLTGDPVAAQLYQYLAEFGYHHPLHPVLTHLPVGLILAGFIFILISSILRRSDYAQTAHHCLVLALLMAIPTVITGYLDWRHFYGGAAIFAIKGKIALAAGLLVLLATVVSMGRRRGRAIKTRVVVHLLAVLMTTGLGYFGGELVYGKKTTVSATGAKIESPAGPPSIAAGEALFTRKCSFCHFTDSTETKVGPGLKGLFQREKMAGSGWPMTPENVRRQLKTPFEQMTAFNNLSDEEIDALIEYLKSLSSKPILP
jgi:cytochrome c2